MTDNTTATMEFVSANSLEKDDFGRGCFAARVSISSGSTNLTTQTTGRFSFANDFEDRITLEETSSLVAGEVPLGFNHQYGQWRCVGSTLLIDGNYRSLGKYTVSIECQ